MANQDDLLSLQYLNLREDEASTKGTKAVQYLVQKLQEAQGNPALSTTVQALLQSHLVGFPPQADYQQGEVDLKQKQPNQFGLSGERGKAPMQQSPKRARSSSTSSLEESGRSRKGRFYRSRYIRSPSLQPREKELVERRHGPTPSSRWEQRPSSRQRRRSPSLPRQ